MKTTFRTLSAVAVIACSWLAAGCSNKTNCNGKACGGPDMSLVNFGTSMLTVTADKPSLTVEKGVGAGTFLTARLPDGTDVTATATWSVGDKAMGYFAQPGNFATPFPLPHGGPVNVSAQFMGIIGGTTIVIDYKANDIADKGASAQAATSFLGGPSTDGEETPQVLYPIDNVMLARNMNPPLTFQWKGSFKDALYRIHVVGSHATYGETIVQDFYIGAGACATDLTMGSNKLLCSYQPDGKSVWPSIALSASGGSATFTVAGTAGGGQPVAESPTQTLNFSPEDVRGGLYYFSPSISGLKRTPFGASTAGDFINGSNSKYVCAGCHALSRDGKKLAATFFGGDGTGGIVDAANPQNYLVKPLAGGGQGVNRWNFATFSPDGKLLLTNWAGVLTLRDGNTAAKKFDLSPALTGGKAVMPEWSPDGNSVVFVQIPPEGKLGKDFDNSNLVAGDWDLGNSGSIAVMKYDNDKGQFMTATPIVPSVMNSEYHYFPSWSPDSEWIVFATAKWPGSSPTAAANLFGYPGAKSPVGYSMSYDQDTARLRLVSVDGGNVIELGNATHSANKATSWPKFAPFIQKQGSLVFFTFGAKFDYGWTVTDGQTPQLWMSAIDLDRARNDMGMTDPSYPPFWVPVQDPRQKNHSGIWTEYLSCMQNSDCLDAEFQCIGGICQKPING
jgi:hypothetical protein